MSDENSFRIGVDIGGTFTDLVLVDEARRTIHSTKILTTPQEPERAVLDGVRRILETVGGTADGIRTLVHGTTLATNAIIERKGAETLLLTTKGFRDVLETRTELRYDLYDLFITFPEPLVPRRRRIGVTERVTYDGAVETPLVRDEVLAALEAEPLTADGQTVTLDDVVRVAQKYLQNYVQVTTSPNPEP